MPLSSQEEKSGTYNRKSVIALNFSETELNAGIRLIRSGISVLEARPNTFDQCEPVVMDLKILTDSLEAALDLRNDKTDRKTESLQTTQYKQAIRELSQKYRPLIQNSARKERTKSHRRVSSNLHIARNAWESRSKMRQNGLMSKEGTSW